MANPLFGGIGGGNQVTPFSPFGNMMNFISQFNQFRTGISGDPKAQVQQLLNSGQMSQEQFNQLSAMAQQFMPFVRR